VRNAKVGGAKTSAHLRGAAIDLVPYHPDDYPALEQFFRARGLLALRESTHLHVQIPSPPPQRQKSDEPQAP